MKLLTEEITKKLQSQYLKGSSFEQDVVCKFFDPQGSWSWYVMNQDPKDTNYLWGIVKGNEIETGSIPLDELAKYKGKFGLGIERDLWFKPMKAQDLWDKLNKGERV